MKHKFANALSLALIMAMLFTSIGLADNLRDDVVAGGNDTFNAGGSTTIRYWIQATGAGNLCDAADGSSATVTINVPAGVAASPSSFAFSACNTQNESNPNNTKSVIFSSSTPGNYLITASVSDTSGTYNTNPADFTLYVIASNTTPALSLPANITAEATSAAGAAVSYSVSATDAQDDPDPTPTCSPASGATFPLGTTTVNCSVTDSGNLSATGSFSVTVQDTTGPSLSLSNVTAEATGGSGAAVTYTASANDLVDGPVAINCSPASGSTFGLGTNVVNCSATDAHSNTSTGSFNVIVQDTTAPVLALPADITAEATGPSGAAVTYTASASDLVDGPVAVNCLPASGSTFGLGTNAVNCSATDAHSNTASGSFNVTVRDTTPPVVTVPSNMTKEATGPNGATVTFSASALDIVDGAVTTTCSPASGSTFALGTTNVNCSAADAHGNTGSASFSVTVVDTTPPTLSLPANITAEATGPSGAVVTFSASASDLVDGPVAISCSPASGSTFALGTTPVSCSATDAHSNTASGSFNVTVQDTTAPTLILPANITAFASGNSSAVVTYTASANDLVDGAVSVSCTPLSGSSFSVGTTTVNCSATDSHSNTAHGSFTVTVSYNFLGFFQPIDNLPALNRVKAGSAIPVKFSLSGNQGLNIFQQGYPGSAVTTCSALSVDDIETTLTAGGSSLSYDASTDQYIYVWKTDKAWAGSCRTLTVMFKDGTTKQANFQFTK